MYTLWICETQLAWRAAAAKSSSLCLDIGEMKFRWYISYTLLCKSWPILPRFSSVGIQKYTAGTSGIGSLSEWSCLKVNWGYTKETYIKLILTKNIDKNIKFFFYNSGIQYSQGTMHLQSTVLIIISKFKECSVMK